MLFFLTHGHLFSAAAKRNRAAGKTKNGGARRDRTDDLKLAKLPLSQLSYGPKTVLYLNALRWVDCFAQTHRVSNTADETTE